MTPLKNNEDDSSDMDMGDVDDVDGTMSDIDECEDLPDEKDFEPNY